MPVQLVERINPKLVKILAAVVIGLSVGALLPPDPVAIDAFGILPGILVASGGTIIGAIMYFRLPKIVGSQSCGCSGDCGCAE